MVGDGMGLGYLVQRIEQVDQGILKTPAKLIKRLRHRNLGHC